MHADDRSAHDGPAPEDRPREAPANETPPPGGPAPGTPDLEIGVEFYDRAVVLDLRGELTEPTHEAAAAVVRSFWSARFDALVLDLHGLDHLDQHGTMILLRIRWYARNTGALLVLVGLHGRPADRLTCYGLTRHFLLAPDRDAALALLD
ncbi:STAS domain-containing protein [Actinomadura parmotrematis]|uniref:STAS domain-containing protein n=1 Tax=Actinomadura parmotrematis TaxID=2864039 RepID=A0ABS7FQD5_9ACTN|nr:STAS domain-containing protein [Actinomadura parmotrematis]MBW8482440.1 STAS domain-containing protein [Actinomadura parmotrematis]